MAKQIKQAATKKKVVPPGNSVVHWFSLAWGRIKRRRDSLLVRRPHRSFRLTPRRDYARSLKLPGYWAFTAEVMRYLWQRKKTFLLLVFVYALVTAAFVGITSQSTYATFSEGLKESGAQFFSGDWSQLGQAGVLLGAGVLGSLSTAPTDMERVIAVIVGLLMWLTTVWLLRAYLAGKKPRLRDALYSAGSPIIATFLILVVLLIQLIPLALAALAFGAASSTGLIYEGVEAMVFWVVEILLLVMSMYWFASTFFALVVVTLPGMYPMQALKTGGDLVIGRRLRIFLRFIWLFVLTFIIWIVVMIPIILFDTWLKEVWEALSWLPLVPICFLGIASLSLLWVCSYTYLLYRKVVDDNVAPA
jgi:hypothetical protein